MENEVITSEEVVAPVLEAEPVEVSEEAAEVLAEESVEEAVAE